jgi:hypothetical protein
MRRYRDMLFGNQLGKLWRGAGLGPCGDSSITQLDLESGNMVGKCKETRNVSGGWYEDMAVNPGGCPLQEFTNHLLGLFRFPPDSAVLLLLFDMTCEVTCF